MPRSFRVSVIALHALSFRPYLPERLGGVPLPGKSGADRRLTGVGPHSSLSTGTPLRRSLPAKTTGSGDPHAQRPIFAIGRPRPDASNGSPLTQRAGAGGG